MGYSSDDNMLYEETTLGKRFRIETSKSNALAQTAGGWHCMVPANGYPNIGTFPGTDLLWQSCWETTGDGTSIIGIQHNGNPGGTATKHLKFVNTMIVAAAGAPWHMKLVDLQGYYRISGANVTGTGSRTLINSNTFTASSSSGLLLTYTNDFNTLTVVQFTTTTTLPTGLSLNTDYYLVRVSATTARVATSLSNAIAGTVIAFTDAGTGTHTMSIRPRNAVGTEAFFCVQTAPTAGGPNLTASSYTNSAGTAGRSFQGSPTFGAAADAYATRIPHSGTGAGRYGSFLPKQGGDVGIRSVESFTLSGGTAYTGSGVMALCLGRTLVDFPVGQSGGAQERELRNQIMSLPKVDDGACLVWLQFCTGATTINSPMNSTLEFGWAG